MSNELVPQMFDVTSLQPVLSEDTMKAVTVESKTFFPRLQMMLSNCRAVLDKKYTGDLNHFTIVQGDNYIPVGASIDVMPLIYLPKAICFSEPVATTRDTSSDLFKSIQHKSDTGSVREKQDNRYGMEVLMYAPQHKMFITFFMCSPTMRYEFNNLQGQFGQMVTIKGKMIEGKKATYYSPIVIACNTMYEMPTIEEITEAAERFKATPEESNVEVATETDRAV